MVASCPSLSVLLEGLFVFSEIILSQLEFFTSLLNGWDILHGSGLEGLLWLKTLLEIHPVLSGVVKCFLNLSLILFI